MAKRSRERGLAERRLEKQARKVARKQAARAEAHTTDRASADEADQPLANGSAVEAATRAFGDMAKADSTTEAERIA